MEPFQLETKSLYLASGQAEAPLLHRPGLHANMALHSAGEVAGARQFFTPRADIQLLAPHSITPGLEHTTAAALQAANQTISPLLQLIMRLPTHVSIFSSFFEALKNFFLPHTELLTQLVHFDASGFNNLSHSLFPLGSHHATGWSIMPAHADIFQNMAFNGDNVTGMAHLHLSPADSLKHSMNMSAGADLQHPQFEKLSESQATTDTATANIAGDSLAGPGISAQAITPHLAPAERIFTSKYFESPAGSGSGSASLAPTTGNLSASSQNGASSNTIASASIPPPPSFSQAPAINDVVDTVPLQGLHAKELSLAGSSISHHSVHTLSGHAHPLANHASAGQHLDNSRIANNNVHDLTKHKLTQQRPATELGRMGSAPTSGANAMPEAAADNSAYQVQSGDSLWSIASHQLGDGMRWQEIYNLNVDKLGGNPNLIYSGTNINLPQADQNILPGTSDGAVIAHQSIPGQYTVKAGDNLWQIAQNSMGNGQHWPDLYKANTDVIGADPRMILPGQKFDMPTLQTNSMLTQHSTTATTQVASAAPVHPTSTHVSHLHNQGQHETIQPSTAKATVGHPTLALNFKLVPENTIVPNAHAQISMHTNINSNNGLAIETNHDKLLSGAGAAAAINPGQNAISRAISNLVSGKAKSVVSFSLAPDLSFLPAR